MLLKKIFRTTSIAFFYVSTHKISAGASVNGTRCKYKVVDVARVHSSNDEIRVITPETTF